MISYTSRRPVTLLLALLLILNYVSAAGSALAPYCATVCVQIIGGFSFSDCQSSSTSQDSITNGASNNGTTGHIVSRTVTKGHGQDTTCYCKSKFFAESYAFCVRDHCLQDDPSTLWVDFAKAYCTTGGTNKTSSSSSIKVAGLAYTEALTIANNLTVPFASISASKSVTAPINITAAEFDPYYLTYDTAKYQHGLGTTHGYVLLGYLAAFIVLATFKKASTYALGSWRSSRKAITARPSYLERRWQQWVLYPSVLNLAGSRHQYPLPVRSHSLIVGGYVILTLALCLSSFTGRLFNDNTNYKNNKSAQLVKYLADRTGMMAVSQLPFLFLFGGRNNIMMCLTGWSFRTFNLYHKWVGRVMWALAFIHTISYSVSYIWSDKYSSSISQLFFIYGIVALSCGSIIMVQAARLVRTRAYETFLVSHITLAAVFLLGMWYHLVEKHNVAWMPYVYCAIAVWAFDRLVRLVRVTYYNIGIKTTSTADITVVENASREDSILLINIRTPRATAPKPGQHIFVHFRSVYPWQAHPFTIMDHDPETSTLRLAAKVHTGLTRALYNHATANAATKLDEKGHNVTSERKLYVAIDGFYGHTAAIAIYDTVLLVAGGAGITAVYPYVKYLLEGGHQAQTKHIRLVWSVRHSIHLEMLRSQLEEMHARVPDHMTLDVEMYASAVLEPVTCMPLPEIPDSTTEKIDIGTTTTAAAETSKPPFISTTPPSPVESGAEDDSISSSSHSHSSQSSSPHSPSKNPVITIHAPTPSKGHIQIQHSRPHISSIIKDTIEEAPSSVAVLACGPEYLMRDVRGAVCMGLEGGRGRVGLFEESFVW